MQHAIKSTIALLGILALIAGCSFAKALANAILSYEQKNIYFMIPNDKK